MIIVTGGAGFIGSNLIRKLNKLNKEEIIIVDNLNNANKLNNINDLSFLDFIDKKDFISNLEKGLFSNTDTIFHQGACSSTTELDGAYLMKNNYEYSKKLLHFCLDNTIQFIYASSASVYGLGCKNFEEKFLNESPANLYAFSKFQFDQYVRKTAKGAKSQVVGLRYFNVYGPREKHKLTMASTAFHFYNQILENGFCKLFKGTDGYKNGTQARDFVYVDDCVDVNLWFQKNIESSGIFNVGTGNAKTFNDMAKNILCWFKEKKNINAFIEYIEFPTNLKNKYQSFTQANIEKLKSIGYEKDFVTLKKGVYKYLDYLNENKI